MSTTSHIQPGILTADQLQACQNHAISASHAIAALLLIDQNWAIPQKEGDYVLLHPLYSEDLAIRARADAGKLASATYEYHYGIKEPSKSIRLAAEMATKPFEVTFTRSRTIPSYLTGKTMLVAFMREDETHPPGVFAATVHADGNYIEAKFQRP